jgi:molecular chaperone HtpG
MSPNERIPFQVDINRVIEVLATQIYPSPLALLRENTQNAFDAILQRRHSGQAFEPTIVIGIEPHRIVVEDNGLGMTPADLRSHYWSAGSSSKNTPEARAAGVVGTFGIGAMANFGVADVVEVETESAVSGERTRSSARRAALSVTEDCIELGEMVPLGRPGTRITAHMAPSSPIDTAEAAKYITEFVQFVDIPVKVNGTLVSQSDIRRSLTPVGQTWEQLLPDCPIGPFLGDATIRVTGAGEVSFEATSLRLPGEASAGVLVLRQGVNTFRTYRSGFGLAVLSLNSPYQFGGAINVSSLEPTAGREALSTASMQLLQTTMGDIDRLVSEALSTRPESDQNTSFMAWVQIHGRYEMCDHLTMRVEPNRPRQTLMEIRELPDRIRVFGGSDQSTIDSLASEDSPLYVYAGTNPRKQCESEYLKRFCQVEELADAPAVLADLPAAQQTMQQQAVLFRVVTLLETDYFLTLDVRLGRLSHGLPVLVEEDRGVTRLYLDPYASTFAVIAALYDSDYSAFGSMMKDFVRTIVFPRVSHLVPSSTRQGAEAFLKSIRRTRDVFEYEYADLEDFAEILEELRAGRLSLEEAAARASNTSTRNVQFLDAGAAMQVRDVVPDVITNEEVLVAEEDSDLLQAAPAISRTEVDTEAKLLTIAEPDIALKGYRCFIALSDRVREQRGDFFLQPHTTSVVWGGQRILYAFEHHSGAFGLYYDLQTSEAVSAPSGGGRRPTATIVLGNRLFIPVPDEIVDTFRPGPSERKRFEVKSDLLYTATEPPSA